MAETEAKDKPPRQSTKTERRHERIEAVASAYFAMCKKIARVLNRGSR